MVDLTVIEEGVDGAIEAGNLLPGVGVGRGLLGEAGETCGAAAVAPASVGAARGAAAVAGAWAAGSGLDCGATGRTASDAGFEVAAQARADRFDAIDAEVVPQFERAKSPPERPWPE